MLGFFFKKQKKWIVETNGEVRIIIFDNKVYLMTISELYKLLKDSGIIGKEFSIVSSVGSYYCLKRNNIEYAIKDFEEINLKDYSGVKTLLKELIIMYEEALKLYTEGNYEINLDSLKQDLLWGRK